MWQRADRGRMRAARRQNADLNFFGKITDALRYLVQHTNTTRVKRICKLCNCHVETEYHFLLVCPSLIDLRIKYLPKYYCSFVSLRKFNELL